MKFRWYFLSNKKQALFHIDIFSHPNYTGLCKWKGELVWQAERKFGTSTHKIMFWAFIIGNILYYAVGIILAYAFKDNRAFCKYICPITVFLKPMSYFSVVRIKCDKSKCISCGKCKKVCPMNVDVTDNSRKRENGTECILCMECIKNCPVDAL